MQWLTLKRYYWLWRTRKQRKKNNALSHYWKKEQAPKKIYWRQADFLAVDIETSSLNLSDGEILSIGWVAINQGRVQLNTAEHHLIKPNDTVGSSATIHYLRDCELDDGIDTEKMLQYFLRAAQNRILVFHHATLDLQFLNHICKQHFSMPLLWPTLDTLQLEKNYLENKGTPLGHSTLRLSSCRTRYNLPPYPAHNALSDALATAELLLAQLSYRSSKLEISDLL
jgi:DNA polymerase-3 subunit epsilon